MAFSNFSKYLRLKTFKFDKEELKIIAFFASLIIALIAIDIWLMIRFYENLLVVFMGMLFLTMVLGNLAGQVGKRVAGPAFNTWLREEVGMGLTDKESTEKSTFIQKAGVRKRWALWRFKFGIALAYVLAYFSIGVLYRIVEGYIGTPEPWFPYSLRFFLSLLVTIAIGWVLFKVSSVFGWIAFQIAAYSHQIRLARLYLIDEVPERAYEVAYMVVINSYVLTGIIVPLVIIFTESVSLVFMFMFSLLLSSAPLVLVLYWRRHLPGVVFFELPRFFIPLQVILGLTTILIVFGGYSFFYYLRFNIGADIGLTIPFNVPRSFDTVFRYAPSELPLRIYAETIFSAVTISTVATWLTAVLFKRAWRELTLGVISAIIIFVIPFALELYPGIVGWFKDQALVIPTLIVAVLAPMAIGLIAQTIADVFFPKTRICSNPNCLYDKLDMYSFFCSRCGHVLPGTEERFQMINEIRINRAKNSDVQEVFKNM